LTNQLQWFIKEDELPEWSRVYHYGQRLDVPLTSSYVLLETETVLEGEGEGRVYAAMPGKLSPRIPGSGVEPDLNLSKPGSDIELPLVVNLYLHIEQAQEALPEVGRIIGFAYLGVERLALEDALKVDTTRFRKLVLGELGVSVSGGQLIGKAAKGADGKRRIGFAVLTEDGPVDPAYVYENMGKEKPRKKPGLVELLGGKECWPVIKTDEKDEAISLTEDYLYPMPVLKHHFYSGSDPALWRRVGNNQKKLYRELLLRRTGYERLMKVPEMAFPPFEFNPLDWRNIFQLEALVEFYVNFGPAESVVRTSARKNGSQVQNYHYNTPWKVGAEPLDPKKDKGRYITIDFFNPKGKSATLIKGDPEVGSYVDFVRLDGEPDLSRVRPGYDTLYLYEAVGRKKAFLIKGLQMDAHLLWVRGEPKLVEGEPMLEGGSTWEISLSPNIVIVDPFGPRVHGFKAECADRTVRLEDCSLADLRKVNQYFDTIYFPDDTRKRGANEARPLRTYRIMRTPDERKSDKREIELDARPEFKGPGRWYIQAGISTDMPPLFYDFKYGRGYDHFDALLFVVKGGQVHAMYRWSSFTAIHQKNGEYLSSIQGNREYNVFSWMSEKCHLNFCFAVVDKGNSMRQDYVRYARFYFPRTVTDDRQTIVENKKDKKKIKLPVGKTEIRLHWSRSQKGQPRCRAKTKGENLDYKNSAGCLVSPLFERFRREMINLYQEDYKAHTSTRNTDLDEIACAHRHLDSVDLFLKDRKLLGARWHGKLAATLWLIRPDERPVG
jgi:hypothetical protein